MQYHLDSKLWGVRLIGIVFLNKTFIGYSVEKISSPYYYNFPENFDFLIDTIVLDQLEYTCKLHRNSILVEPI